MKTTRAQQDATRARLVEAAATLMGAQGFDAVSMKDIAREAGVGDATIYKYFPTKERLILGYFDLRATQAVAVAAATPEFDQFDLHARLQRLTDAVLEGLAPNRPFVALARELLARSPLLLLGDELQAKGVLKEAVAGYFEDAVAVGELPPSDHHRFIAGLYADFCQGVIAYWLHDPTEGAAETTRLSDELLGLLVAALRAGLPDRLVSLAGFLLRSQLARLMDQRLANESGGGASPGRRRARRPWHTS
jgi:AcrR family transcriptional regulator